VVPPCSGRISRVPPYSRIFALSTRTGLSPAMAAPPRAFRFLNEMGERLSTPLRILCPPRWTLRQRAIARLRHRHIRELGAFLQPRPFAWSEERRVDEAIRCRQLQPLVFRRTSETGAFFAPRMRTPRGLSRSLWSLHRITSTSDVPIVARRHTRVGIRYPPDLLPEITVLADA